MLSKFPFIVCVLALVSLCAVSSAKADSVPVVNADFSQLGAPLSNSCGTNCAWNYGPIPGWSISGSAGTQILNSNYYASVPSASGTMAFINGGTISQDLGISLTPDSTYTLTVYVGDRLDGYTTGYGFGLAAGSTTLVYQSNNKLITPGTFAPETITFTTGSSVDSGDLTVFLSDTGVQADFTNVSLSVVSTPEPSSLLMLGIGLLGLLFLGKRFGLKRPEQLTVSN
ncbi:MAG TPA: PEP-CTERM sorting domain-containing protein [Terriglobales bacterium]|nr:PEP-CTERM sorting domain-containing protein [Terriglobales bacterium]